MKKVSITVVFEAEVSDEAVLNKLFIDLNVLPNVREDMGDYYEVVGQTISYQTEQVSPTKE